MSYTATWCLGLALGHRRLATSRIQWEQWQIPHRFVTTVPKEAAPTGRVFEHDPFEKALALGGVVRLAFHPCLTKNSSSNSDNLVNERVFQSLRCARPCLTEEACSHDHPTCQLGCFLDERALAKKNINICTSTQSEMRSPRPQQESCPHQKRNGIYPLFVPRRAQKMHSCGFTVDTSRDPAARARPQQETRCQLLLSNTGRQKRPKVRTCAPHQ